MNSKFNNNAGVPTYHKIFTIKVPTDAYSKYFPFALFVFIILITVKTKCDYKTKCKGKRTN